ncbi:MAG: DUF4388 domain-containing protein [Acidimicrobiales bacterium]|nr:DUF4388 domain-containing protein [Acidimicrobiales bacterium]
MSSSTSGLEGRLDEVPFADVLRLLQSSRQEGTLHLEGESSIVVVVAPDEVRLAANGVDLGLRQAVLGGGLVDTGTWDRVVAETADAAEPGAAVRLLEQRGADPQRLRSRLYEHTVSTLFELLLPSDARFHFTRGESHPFASEPGFPFDDVLADVRHRVEEWREIATSIPSTDMVLRRTARLPLSSGPITLSPEEFELLGLLDGRRDITQLIQILGMSAFRVMTLLHRLVQVGAAEPVEAQR